MAGFISAIVHLLAVFTAEEELKRWSSTAEKTRCSVVSIEKDIEMDGSDETGNPGPLI